MRTSSRRLKPASAARLRLESWIHTRVANCARPSHQGPQRPPISKKTGARSTPARVHRKNADICAWARVHHRPSGVCPTVGRVFHTHERASSLAHRIRTAAGLQFLFPPPKFRASEPPKTVVCNPMDAFDPALRSTGAAVGRPPRPKCRRAGEPIATSGSRVNESVVSVAVAGRDGGPSTRVRMRHSAHAARHPGPCQGLGPRSFCFWGGSTGRLIGCLVDWVESCYSVCCRLFGWTMMRSVGRRSA